MYGLNMYYTIKTLLSKGKSELAIDRELSLHRDTVRNIKTKLESGKTGPEIQERTKKLSVYHDEIREFYEEKGLTAQPIYDKLVLEIDGEYHNIS